MEELHRFMEVHRELEDSLASTIKISHSEVLRLVLKDLISKRNCDQNKIRDSFDVVLRYYIDEDEFKRFVLDGEEF